jgi:hypothetical protein
MVDFPQHKVKMSEKDDKNETVVMKKDEVIDVLKTLEGLKRRLQVLLKT